MASPGPSRRSLRGRPRGGAMMAERPHLLITTNVALTMWPLVEKL